MAVIISRLYLMIFFINPARQYYANLAITPGLAVDHREPSTDTL